MKKIITFLAAGLALLSIPSCTLTKDEVSDEGGGLSSKELSIEADTYVITADGISAAYITVKNGGEVVTEGVKFYDANNKPTDLIEDMVFTTTTPGVYTFWASYKTLHTDKITIKAISAQIPSLPGDPAPSSSSFQKRVLITQYTGTGCGWCPIMISVLRAFNADPEYKDKGVITALHSYNDDDPMYIPTSLNSAMNISAYPAVNFNLIKSSSMNVKYQDPAAELQLCFQPAFDKQYKKQAKAGISVASLIDGNQLVLNIETKAAVSGEYKVAAWLMEDNIKAPQANNGISSEEGFNTHHNAIRAIAGQASLTDFYGYGTKLEKGGKYRHLYIFDLDETWKREDLHFAVLVSYRESTGYEVTNVINCIPGETYPYEYAE